jgi:hypothetical protein
MNRVCSIFVQILQLISRAGSEAAVRRHRAERTPAASAVGDSSWACCSANWGRPSRLREISGGLAADSPRGNTVMWRGLSRLTGIEPGAATGMRVMVGN